MQGHSIYNTGKLKELHGLKMLPKKSTTVYINSCLLHLFGDVLHDRTLYQDVFSCAVFGHLLSGVTYPPKYLKMHQECARHHYQ